MIAGLSTGPWSVPNHRGRQVSLLEGPGITGCAIAAALLAGAPALPVLAGGCGAFVAGRIDDVWGSSTVRGLRGHGRAVLSGAPTTGAVKVGLLMLTGALTAVAAPAETDGGRARRAIDTSLTAANVTLFGNLANLLDLRPGRALKVVVLAGAAGAAGSRRARTDRQEAGAAVLAGTVAAALGWLPADLAERSMLGDAGANPIGALTGLGLALRLSRRGNALLLLGAVALTLLSERVSFSRAIDATPPLRALDRWGRQPTDR